MNEKKDRLSIVIHEDKTVFHHPDTSILETLEANNVEVHSHCREGFCGACRCKLKSGTVEYQTDPLAYFDDDEILTCCTIPTSDIEISFD